MAIIRGFVFTVRVLDVTRRVRLAGNGGLMGNGLLAVIHTDDDARRGAEQTLRRARAELEREGYVREWHAAMNPADRVRRIVPDEIVACEPIWS